MVKLTQDWYAAMLWIAMRLGFSSVLSEKERTEVSNILDLKMDYYLEQNKRLPTGHEIMQMFEKTYDDIYWFYHIA